MLTIGFSTRTSPETMVALSASPYLFTIANIFASTSIGFGLNAILRPIPALAMFGELEYKPASPLDKKVIDTLMLVYGVRNLYMGLAVFAAAYYNHAQMLGWLLIAGSAIGFADGAICRKVIGHGQGSHWMLVPMFSAVGAVCLGLLDS